MIRPITCISFLLACTSGLYLYQTKHRVRQLDAQIEAVAHQAQQVREQSRVLRAEWTLLDQPDRLQTLASQFLPALQPTKPGQFVTAAELDSRLPAVEQPAAPSEPLALAPTVASDAVADEPDEMAQENGGSDDVRSLPLPAGAQAVAFHPAPVRMTPVHPGTAASSSTFPHVTDKQGAEGARSETRQVSPQRQLAVARAMTAEAHPASRARLVRPAATSSPSHALQRYPAEAIVRASVTPAYPARRPMPPAYGGSLLGMARAAAPPPPTPVWTDWSR